MAEIRLRPMESRDYPSVEALWNACVKAGEVLYYPLTEKRFLETLVRHEGCEPGNLLVAETDGRITGMVHGVAPGTFRLSRPVQAYLTCLLVAPEARGQGVGSALLRTLKARMREAGADIFVFADGTDTMALPYAVYLQPESCQPGLADSRHAGA